MNKENKECCEKCIKEPVQGGDFGRWCGNKNCPCHQPHPPQDWRERFDKEFLPDKNYLWNEENVKSFIEKVETQAIERERERFEIKEIGDLEMKEKLVKNRILEAVEGIQNDESRFCNCSTERCGYNQALKEVINIIKNK